MFKRKLLAIATFIGALSIPGVAMAAAVSAITTSDLNIRVGPGASYARFATIPYGDNVRVHGCIAGYNWCDVSWAGTRGWVSGSYLAYLGDRYHRRSIPSVAVSIGVPVLTYNYNNYYDRYYVGHNFRGYHFDRYRQHHRRAIRHERREHRRDIRHERREHRQEVRQERRERKHEIRQERRHERRREIRHNRHERRQEIRQHRQERRQDARQERRHERRQEVRKDRRKRGHEAPQERRQERRDMRKDRHERRHGN